MLPPGTLESGEPERLSEVFIRRSFSEFPDFQAGLQTLRVNGVPTEPERFCGSISAIHFPDISVEVVRTGPVLLFGGPERDRAGYLLLLQGAVGAKWNGRSVDKLDVAWLRSDSAFMASFPGPSALAFLSTDPATDAEVFGCRPVRGWKPEAGASMQRAEALAHQGLSKIVQAAERAGKSDPEAISHKEGRRALRASMLEASRSLLRGSGRIPLSRGNDAGRQRAVRAADEYLCANPMRPIYTEDLCTALGVSASALHEAFQAMFGISPHRYLKLRRMSLVRAALLSRAGPWASVKAAALSYGFWHLGQFGQDYRKTYGELPSATLARANLGIDPVSDSGHSTHTR